MYYDEPVVTPIEDDDVNQNLMNQKITSKYTITVPEDQTE